MQHRTDISKIHRLDTAWLTLKSHTHVFVHHDYARKSLHKPYGGSYKVQKRADKHFTVDIMDIQK